MRIFVDADVCPVKQEIMSIALKFHFNVHFVASYNHLSDKKYGGDWTFVDTGKEAVDLYIVNHVKKDDVVVTQDIGLAGILLKKGVHVITPRGKQYTVLKQHYNSAIFRRKKGEAENI